MSHQIILVLFRLNILSGRCKKCHLQKGGKTRLDCPCQASHTKRSVSMAEGDPTIIVVIKENDTFAYYRGQCGPDTTDVLQACTVHQSIQRRDFANQLSHRTPKGACDSRMYSTVVCYRSESNFPRQQMQIKGIRIRNPGAIPDSKKTLFLLCMLH